MSVKPLLLWKINVLNTACKVLALVWFYHIFPHYLVNGMIFGKKVTDRTSNT